MPAEVIRTRGHDRRRSLGWLACAWVERFCVHGPGDIQGTPLSGPGAIPLTDELGAFTVDAYALDPGGRRLYDSAFYSRPKGADKSGHFARIGLFEAMGPCRFAGWARGGEVYEQMDFRYVYEPGEPMGRPITYPFLRIMATEEGQTGNVYDAIHFNLTEGPLREAFRGRLDDVGLTRVFLPGGGEIRPSTASSSAKDGGKETWVNYDETHLYTKPELHRMYATVRRNLAKRREAEPWSGESSTMYAPGADSVAERTHALARRIREGKVRRPRLLFDHREAPPDVDLTDEAQVRAGLREAYGDADYMDWDRIVAEIWDPRNEIADSQRFFFNQATAAADSWVTRQQWDRRAKPGRTVKPKALVTLGFDGSKSDDHTALVAWDVEADWGWPVGIWDPQQHDPHEGCPQGRCGEAPRDLIDAAVHQVFRDFDVVGFLSDLHPWESYVDAWAREYGRQLCVESSSKHAIAWDMRGRGRETTQAVEEFHAAVLDDVLTHSGDPVLAQHVYNARRRPNQYGVTVGKAARESADKIDAAVAAVLARKARQLYLALPPSKQRRKRGGKAVFW